MEIENDYKITLHSYKEGYIAETKIENSKSGKYSDYELIFIVDRSGSMSRSYPILINKIIPYLLVIESKTSLKNSKGLLPSVVS